MAPQKKRPGSAVARPLTSGAPVALSTPFASGSSGRRSGRKPVARMIASKRSAGDCLKSTLSRVKLAMSPAKLDPSVPYRVERADVDKRHAPVLLDCLDRPLGGALQAELFDRADRELDEGRVDAVGHARREPLFGGGKDKDRQSEQLARNDIDRAADGESHVNSGFGEVERDLRAGIAIADDEHTFSCERGRIAIALECRIGPPNVSMPGHVGA